MTNIRNPVRFKSAAHSLPKVKRKKTWSFLVDVIGGAAFAGAIIVISVLLNVIFGG